MNVEFLIGLVPWIVIIWSVIRLGTLLWGDIVIPREADVSQPERDAIRKQFEARHRTADQTMQDSIRAIDRAGAASQQYRSMWDVSPELAGKLQAPRNWNCRYCGMPLERSICTHCGAPTVNTHTQDPRLVAPEYTIRN